MKEIEVKLLEINKAQLEKQLVDLGATNKGKRLFKAKAYDFEDERIQNSGGTALCRLRQEGDVTRLAFKYGRTREEGYRIVDELEVEVNDFQTMEDILGKLGLAPYRYREKYRTTYELDGVHVEIDEYPGIPPFAEFEGTKETIAAVLDKLGHTIAETTDKTGSEVLRDYGIDPTHLVFEN